MSVVMVITFTMITPHELVFPVVTGQKKTFYAVSQISNVLESHSQN